MKKRAVMVAIALVAFLILSLLSVGIFAAGGADPRGDWSYPLENGYEVWRVNSKEIVVCWREDPAKASASIVIDSYVSEIAIAEGWLCTKRLDRQENGTVQYYLLDMKEKELYGPYETEESFETQRNRLGFIQPLIWLRTKDEVRA